MARYSAQIRNTILKKLLPPENRTAASLAREYNIAVTTIYGWLREQGFHSQHLIVWEQEVKDALTKREQEIREELKAAKKKIREQEREFARKDKALSEAAIIEPVTNFV
ncbi:MAG TPA: hypothetical protein PLB48_09010 [Treponema sp.]|nr:hypothetical protein [Treponema sp.]HPC71932.1 hypothetical protein [Treponema sp.]HRS05136.1 hypothetical protein [Treponema sp.]